MDERTADRTVDSGQGTSPRLIPLPRRAGQGDSALPRPLTPLIGREHEAAAVVDLLQRDGVRLVTLTGPGGVGKTRLALDIAAALADEFTNGVAWAPLAPLAQASLVVSAIAQVFGVREAGDDALLKGVISVLREKHLLLVLDNFEHLLDAAGPVAELLAACPLVTALVTSRALLRVSGEHAFPVPPLALPSADDTLGLAQPTPAVQLFVDRARAVVPSFALTEANAPAVEAICRRLDGLPLAIELAAARTNLMPPATLLVRLDRRLPLLTGGARDRPERQRTLRAAIAWSYDLLTAEEQLIFRRLGVFVGGAPLDAAMAVCAADGGEPDPLAAVSALVDGSLLLVAEEPAGHPRFVMLETVREYALEQLDASDDAPARQAHAAYYLDLAGRLNIWKALTDQATALALLAVEHANLRAALAWLWDQGAAGAVPFCRLCEDAFTFWWARGHLQEAQDWLNRALTLTVPPAERASVLRGASYLRLVRGEPHLAASFAREAVECASAVGYHWIHAWALFALGYGAELTGAVSDGVRWYEEGLVVARQETEPYPFQVAILIECLARAAFRLGDLDRAETLARESVAALAPFGERYGIGYGLRDLGWVRFRKGDLVEALDAWGRAFQAAREVDDPQQMVDSLTAFAWAALDAGQAALAARWLGAASAQRERSGREPDYREEFEQAVALARSRLGSDRFDAALLAGSGLAPSHVWGEIEDAALGEGRAAGANASAPASSTPGPRLTPREHAILDLLVAGQTDREIADALFVSVRTVEGHVAKILNKLGVRTRTAAATAAIAAGLVAPDAPARSAPPH